MSDVIRWSPCTVNNGVWMEPRKNGYYIGIEVYDQLRAELDRVTKERDAALVSHDDIGKQVLWQALEIEKLKAQVEDALAEVQKCKDIWHVAENELRTGDLRDQIYKAREQRDLAMEFTRHQKDCDQMQNSDCKCSCGLTEIQKEIAKEKEGK